MSDPKFIQSALSCAIREDGTEVRIDICRLETTDWSLEVVDETGRPQCHVMIMRGKQSRMMANTDRSAWLRCHQSPPPL
jgi:hypothetical protein